jgi:hypothetical protein
LGCRCKRPRYATPSWAPAKEAPPVLVAVENAAQEYGPWQWARAFGAATGRFGAEAFSLQDNGMLRCPAGANLWLSEVRQENAFTQRAVYVASQTDCPQCELRGQCLGRGAKGNRARRVSAVRRLLPGSSSVQPNPHLLAAIRWVDGAGRALRRTWMARFPSARGRGASSCGTTQARFSPSSSATCRALAEALEVGRSARTNCLVGASATAHHGGLRSCLSCSLVTQEELANTETMEVEVVSPRLR